MGRGASVRWDGNRLMVSVWMYSKVSLSVVRGVYIFLSSVSRLSTGTVTTTEVWRRNSCTRSKHLVKHFVNDSLTDLWIGRHNSLLAFHKTGRGSGNQGALILPLNFVSEYLNSPAVALPPAMVMVDLPFADTPPNAPMNRIQFLRGADR